MYAPQGASQSPSIFFYVDNFQGLQNEHVLLIQSERNIDTLLFKKIIKMEFSFQWQTNCTRSHVPWHHRRTRAETKRQSSKRNMPTSKRDGGGMFVSKKRGCLWIRLGMSVGKVRGMSVGGFCGLNEEDVCRL